MPRRPIRARIWASVEITFLAFIFGRRTTELEVGQVRAAFTLLNMKGAIAAGHPLTAEAGRPRSAGGRHGRRRVRRGRVRLVGVRKPADGPGRGRVHARRTRRRAGRRSCWTSSSRCRGRRPRASCSSWRSTSTATRSRCSARAPAAVAVPGTALGLAAAHARWGRRAVGGARRAGGCAGAGRVRADAGAGVPARDPRSRCCATRRRAMRCTASRARVRAGERFAIPELGATLDRLGEEGRVSSVYGRSRGAIVAHVRRWRRADAGGSRRAIEVIEREPVSVAYRGHEFRSNPPPSSGGLLIALGLESLGDRSRRRSRSRMRWRRRRRRATPRSRGRSTAAAWRCGAEGHDAHLGRRRATATPRRSVASLGSGSAASSSRARAST